MAKKHHTTKETSPEEITDGAEDARQAGGAAETDDLESGSIAGATPDEAGVYDFDEVSPEADTDADAHELDKSEVLKRMLEKNEIIMTLSKELKNQEKEAAEANEKWLRTAAEFENYRKRSRKEWDLLKQQAKAEIILDVLDVVDNFERAFSVVSDADSDEFVQGIKLIHSNLVTVLEKSGVAEVEAHEKSFDPNYHMAVAQVDSDQVESGHVVEVVQKGYSLNDTVIRPAKVVVAK